MKTERAIILEIGYNPLKADVVIKVVKGYLGIYASKWILQQTAIEWIVTIQDATEGVNFRILEKEIKQELFRLTKLYRDLKTLGDKE